MNLVDVMAPGLLVSLDRVGLCCFALYRADLYLVGFGEVVSTFLVLGLTDLHSVVCQMAPLLLVAAHLLATEPILSRPCLLALRQIP